MIWIAWFTDTALTMIENIYAKKKKKIKKKKAGLTVELLIMDDESKGTPTTEKIVKELQSEGHNVRIHVRRKGEGRGLSSAVLLGFSMAK
jgi:dolichol-phosphate mannosyltransferase